VYVAWTLIEPAEPLAIKAISAVVIGLVAYVIMSHQALIEPAEPLAIKAISAVVIGLVAYVIMSHQGIKHEHDEMAGEHAGMMQEHDLLKRVSSDLKREVEMLKSKINSLMHRERKEKFCQPLQTALLNDAKVRPNFYTL
jgi:fatty acid/phospholipid biosynthesis enzyme